MLLAISNSSATQSSPDERTQLIAAAQKLYVEQGLAAVTLDAVADSLGLPLGTLLRWFPAKDILVRAVVDALADRLHQKLYQHKESSCNAAEELFALCHWVSGETRTSYATLSLQVEADYPTAWQRWQEHALFPLEHLRNNLRWGVLQDLYQAHLDVERQVEIWFQQLSTLGFEPVVVPHLLFESMLAGIVTPAGRASMAHLQTAAR